MKHQKISRILQWCALALALLAAGLQTYALQTAYDAERGYFNAGTLLPLLAAILALLSGALGILCATRTRKEELSTPIINSALAGIPATCGLGYGAFLLLTASKTPSALTVVTAVTMLLAALYSLLLSPKMAERFPAPLALLGFFAVAACAAINVYCYFDPTVEMNAPIKVTLQTGLLFAMLYYTAEIRYLLGRTKPRLYLALSHCAIAALALSAFPIAIARNNGVEIRADYYALTVASLGILIGIVLRNLCSTGVIADDEPEEVAAPTVTEESEETEETGVTEETEDAEKTEECGESAPPAPENDSKKENDEE